MGAEPMRTPPRKAGRAHRDDIVVVGLGCLLPGATTPDELWASLLEGRDNTREATAHEMGVDPAVYFHPERGHPDTYYWTRGGFAGETDLDLRGYRVPPSALAGLDDVYTWPLHAARAALREGGLMLDDAALARCGLILGNLSFPTRTSQQLVAPLYRAAVEPALAEVLGRPDFRLPRTGPEHAAPAHIGENGLLAGEPAAVVARALGLGAPAFAIDAACATSLYAIKLACQILREGRADLMLAAAVSAADPFFIHMGFSIFQAYPHGSESRPLDRSSGGLISGQGAGALLLKRRADALRDGDRVYATIRGLGWSNDGRGKHPLTPRPQGQARAFTRAYAEAGLDPRDIGYVECHATGTPIGDATELDAMGAFFGAHGAAPLIGSVKSNIGHLLTAAGMAGTIKTILAMEHGTIPPTIRVEDPAASSCGAIAAERVVRAATPWPGPATARRAGVSAFGFGGANAHLVLEGGTGDEAPGATGAEEIAGLGTSGRLAIVGMAARFGDCPDLAAFARAIDAGQPRAGALPADRGKGLAGSPDAEPRAAAYLDGFDFDFLRCRVPPTAEDRPIPQQLLMLGVADRAVRDAGLREGTNAAVVIAMGTEPALHQYRARVDLGWQVDAALKAAGLDLAPAERDALLALARDVVHERAGVNQYTSFIGNIMASRVASLWDFSGPAFTVSAEDNSALQALDVARLLLADGDVEAVVLGAVDLAAGPESILLRGDRPPAGFVGEGAGAVVLKRLEDAQAAGDSIYAAIDAVAVVQAPDRAGPAAETVARACQDALAAAGRAPQDVAYIDAQTAGLPTQTAAEVVGLVAAYGGEADDPTCALGSVAAVIGDCYAAAGMAALIKAAICLTGRSLPATSGWSGPCSPDLWTRGPFYVPTERRPWFRPAGHGPRVAAVNGVARDGTCAHVLLSDEGVVERRPAAWRQPGGTAPVLVMLAADDLAGLLARVDALDAALAAAPDADALSGLARQCAAEGAGAAYALVLLGRDADELRREASRARAGIGAAFESGGEWRTPAGSMFTARPLGARGEVAFVYPGAHSAYLGLGRELFDLFPGLWDLAESQSADVGGSLAERRLYPRSLTPPATADLPGLERTLLEDSPAMVGAATSFAVLATSVARDIIGLRPAAAFGYSLGESAMLWALGVWADGDRMRTAPETARCLRRWLEDPTDLLAAAGWRPGGGAVADGPPTWATYLVLASREQVAVEVAREPGVYLTLVNGPREMFIAGDAAACRRVLDRLGVGFAPAPFNQFMHSPAAAVVHDELIALHTWPVAARPEVRLYSAAGYAPMALETDVIAQSLATVLGEQLDFPRLVERVYADGARVFVEIGPAAMCSKWIRATLGDRPHASVSLDQKGLDSSTALARALAVLVSHRVSLDLAPFLGAADAPGAEVTRIGRSLVQRIELGGPDIGATIRAEGPIALRRATGAVREAVVSATVGAPRERVAAAAASTPVPRRVEPAVVESSSPVGVAPARGDAAQVPPPAVAAGAIQPPTSVVRRVPAPSPTTALPVMTAGSAMPHRTAASVPAVPSLAPILDHAAQIARSHETFLRTRSEALGLLAELVALQITAAEHTLARLPLASEPERAPSAPTLPPPADDAPAASNAGPLAPIWDEADLREFAGGSIARVFGPAYAAIDTYRRRVRLPMPPYLLVSRVTRLDAALGRFEPSRITTEYDIPHRAWYTVDGQVPLAVAVESGQCDLLLISYLGIDLENKGERVYRLLDCTLTFLGDLPHEGDTLRYDISINSFARSGDSLLFFFSYECFVGERLILTMDGGCAGFFTDRELADGKGIIATEAERAARERVVRRSFRPLLPCPRRSFDADDLRRLSAGDLARVFGAGYRTHGRNPSLRLPPPEILMVDRVVEVDPSGGAWGLGTIVAEKDLRPDDWYFPCHFKDDQVLAGSLMAEGCSQVLQMYLLYLGVQIVTRDARFEPIPNLRQVVRCRGQVTPSTRRLTYCLEVTDIGLTPAPYAVVNVDVLADGKPVVRFTDLGLRLADNAVQADAVLPDGDAALATPSGVPFDERAIQQFATGDIVSVFGAPCAPYAHRRLPRVPNTELQLISRVVEIDGTCGVLTTGATMESVYDVPSDAWYLREAAAHEMPYSILMEIALQPCGFLSGFLGSTLGDIDEDFYFRNLDGRGRLLRPLDVVGKTITARVQLTTSAAVLGAIIQKFGVTLACDGVPFFEGDAAFGYFSAQALANQVGLDGGKRVPSWYDETGRLSTDGIEVDLAALAGDVTPEQPRFGLDGPSLSFLDRVVIVPGGGRHGRGYAWAERRIDPFDWFFGAHFFQDPVMPGSLGVEAMRQALKAFALQQGLGADFLAPRFAEATDHETVWKYRGQILPTDERMTLDLHVARIDREQDGLTIVADASFWRDGLRIYEVTGLAVSIVEMAAADPGRTDREVRS